MRAAQGLDETTNGGVEQVHLTYWGSPDKMLVSFSSGTPTITPVPAASATRPDTSSKPCAVFAPVPSTQGPTAEAVESSFMNALSTAGGVEAAVASGWLNLQFGFSTSYVQDTAWPGYNYTVLNYVSGKLSHVLLTGEAQYGIQACYNPAAARQTPFACPLGACACPSLRTPASPQHPQHPLPLPLNLHRLHSRGRPAAWNHVQVRCGSLRPRTLEQPV